LLFTIYEDLKEIADPGHTCLVVWDVQNGLVGRIFNKEEFIGNLKRFVETMRNKVPVVYALMITEIIHYAGIAFFDSGL